MDKKLKKNIKIVKNEYSLSNEIKNLKLRLEKIEKIIKDNPSLYINKLYNEEYDKKPLINQIFSSERLLKEKTKMNIASRICNQVWHWTINTKEDPEDMTHRDALNFYNYFKTNKEYYLLKVDYDMPRCNFGIDCFLYLRRYLLRKNLIDDLVDKIDMKPELIRVLKIKKNIRLMKN